MATIGIINNENGFSVDFSETVKLQMAGWTSTHFAELPNATTDFDNYEFILADPADSDADDITFIIKNGNNLQTMYKATYSTASEKWSLAEFTPAP
ncbi:hypothetical protein ACIQZI_12590 [Peribacillus sp. NPDC096379]|uniref:hypothetical protein n=1 Tax=Peribacillus sp. NPDC096379 TaxID=3364393 RepID=UPI00380588F3